MQTPLSPLVPMGEWAPDQPDTGEFARIAENVLTQGGDYVPFSSLQEATAALPASCKGAVAVKALDGTVFVFAGTDTKLYRLVGNTWTDVSRASNYSTGPENRWVFAQYGNVLLASNFTNELQAFTLGTSTLFADVAGAPRAKVLAVVNNFVVAGHTFDAVDGTRRNRVRWCAINNPLDWANNPTVTQADFQDIPNGGEVQAIQGFDNHAIVVQEKEIKRMEYVGDDLIFSITTAEPVRGAVANGSVVGVGNQIFFLGEDGFYAFAAQGSVPIGNKKIDKWFSRTLKAGTENDIITTFNPLLKIVVWGFVSTGSDIDTLLIYNWSDNRWTYVKQNVQAFLVALTASRGLESLGAQYAGLENIPFGLDSIVWAGGKTLPAAFTLDNKMGYFNGPAMPALVEGGEARLNMNGRAFVSAVYPHTDASDLDCEVCSRFSLKDMPVSTGVMALGNTGEYVARTDNTFHRIRISLRGTWSYLRGVQFRARGSGAR
jgi:hypothetical protein